jgi:ABC-type antimicrobial peptide transport system permease subunit
MNVDFRRPNNSDTIYLKAQVVMPAGVTFKPATDAVNLNIDGFIIDIPAGSFKSTAWWWNQSYTYKSKGNSGPVINITWNCQKCEFILTVRKANVDVINNYDGVAITLRVGSIMGFADIDMFIDSLSYPANR